MQPALKYVSHELSFEELYGKPQWFKDLTAHGLIPVIAYQHKAGDQHAPPLTAAAAAPGVVVIRESLVCLEFLEDAHPKPAVSGHVASKKTQGQGCLAALVSCRLPAAGMKHMPWLAACLLL